MTGATLAPPPDLETSSDRYALRFSGPAGAYLLDVQSRGLSHLIERDSRGLASALDVGGGHGQLVETLLRHGLQTTVVGSGWDCAERLKRNPQADRVTYEAGDLLALPYGDRSFDLITSIRLLAHISDPDRLIDEMCRTAGRSVIVDYPTWVGPNALALATFPIKKLIEKDTRTYRTFWPGEIARAFERNGFRPAGTFKQFTAPMGLHRLAGKSVRIVEEGLRRTGVTALIGNPVLQRFDRISA
ncbi:MAG: class I SAM-dependent methyltransferase [Sphingobium sp.]